MTGADAADVRSTATVLDNKLARAFKLLASVLLQFVRHLDVVVFRVFIHFNLVLPAVIIRCSAAYSGEGIAGIVLDVLQSCFL